MFLGDTGGRSSLEGKVVDRKLRVQINLLSNGNFRKKKKIKEKVEISLKIFFLKKIN
jgi:hypothetical protein